MKNTDIDLPRLQAIVASMRESQSAAAHASRAIMTNTSELIRSALLAQYSQYDSPLITALALGLQGKGVPLAALSVCGRGTEEVRFTKLLSYFLDPSKPHGLKDRLIRAVLEPELLELNLQIHDGDWQHVRVKSEFPLDGPNTRPDRASFIDILLEFGDFNVFIEEKILSNESSDGKTTQLARYTNAICNNADLFHAKNVHIYLTPSGRMPSDPIWRALSHRDFFSRSSALAGDVRLPRIARYNLCCLLWDLFMGPIAGDEENLSDFLALLIGTTEHPERYIELRRWCASNISPESWPTLMAIAETLHES